MEEKNASNGNYLKRIYDPRVGVPPPSDESFLGTMQAEQVNLLLPDIQSIKAENAKMLKKSVHSLKALKRASSNYLSHESRCLDLQISNLFSAISSEDVEDTLTSEVHLLQHNLSGICSRISEIEKMLEDKEIKSEPVQCGCPLF